MKPFRSALLLASAASVLSLAACNSAKDEKASAPVALRLPAATASTSETVASVNGAPISKSSIDLIVKQGGEQGQPDNPETRNAILDQLTTQMVLAEEAVKKGLDKTADVTEKLNLIRLSVLAEAYLQDYIKNNPVSEDALKAEYDRIKPTITGSEYKARHILVEKESEAREIIAKLKKDPGAFAKLAAEKSKDPGSKAKGGELGWFDPSRMVPEFGAAVSKLEKGKVTEEPVKTQFGYHVIQLEDSKPIEAPPFEEIKPNLSQQLQQQNLKKQVDDLKAKAKIEVAGALTPAASAPAASAAPGAASAAK